MKRYVLMILGAIAICASLQSRAAAQNLTTEKFEKLHNQLKPKKNEPWRTIPWTIRLLDAQRKAAKERKPIFIWAMDGHPLGCT